MRQILHRRFVQQRFVAAFEQRAEQQHRIGVPIFGQVRLKLFVEKVAVEKQVIGLADRDAQTHPVQGLGQFFGKLLRRGGQVRLDTDDKSSGTANYG